MMNAHLHGGKWTEEEELYATALIEAFKAGVLPPGDIEEGTSLRKYLAKKLLCSPKRVSKKYEGTNYNGKQVYFKSRGSMLMSPEEQVALLSKIQMLEHNFLKGLSETKASEGFASRSSSQEEDIYSQLQRQAISAAEKQSSPFAAAAAQLQPHASLAFPQASFALSRQSTHSSLGSAHLGNLSGGARSLLGSSSLSLMSRTHQDQELARMAARLNAGGLSSLVSSSGLSPRELAAFSVSASPQLLSQADSDRINSSINAARLQQLEQSFLRNQQQQATIGTNPLVGFMGGPSSLDGMRVAAANRLLGQQPSALEASIIDTYLQDATQSMLQSTASVHPNSATLDLLGGSIHSQLLQMNSQLLQQRGQTLSLPIQDQARLNSQLLGGANFGTNLALGSASKRPGEGPVEPTAKRPRQG